MDCSLGYKTPTFESESPFKGCENQRTDGHLCPSSVIETHQALFQASKKAFYLASRAWHSICNAESRNRLKR